MSDHGSRSRSAAATTCAPARSPDAPDTDGLRGPGSDLRLGPLLRDRLDGGRARRAASCSSCRAACCAASICHNPDTWHLKDGTRIELAQAVRRLGDFAPALRAMGGGLTISGGEPLVQIGFTRGMFAAAKRMGLHTALDTSGFLGYRADDDYLAQRRSRAARHQERRSRHLSQGDRRGARSRRCASPSAWPRWASRSGSASCWCRA